MFAGALCARISFEGTTPPALSPMHSTERGDEGIINIYVFLSLSLIRPTVQNFAKFNYLRSNDYLSRVHARAVVQAIQVSQSVKNLNFARFYRSPIYVLLAVPLLSFALITSVLQREHACSAHSNTLRHFLEICYPGQRTV